MFEKKIATSVYKSESLKSPEEESAYEKVGYSDYLKLCNVNNDGSRLRGILSSEIYEEIIKDSDTMFIESCGRLVPAIVDIKYGLSLGYDTKRCVEYSEDISENTKILAVPVHELNNDESIQLVEIIKEVGDMALYFSDHNNDEARALIELFSEADIDFFEKGLFDPRAKDEDRQASLYLYSYSAEQDSIFNAKDVSLSDVYDYYLKNTELFASSDNDIVTDLYLGDKINDEQAEDMWNLYDRMFEFLGDGHPISMQDSKDDFLRLLRSNSTLIASTSNREDGSLACFTYFIDDMTKLYWLNQSYLQDRMRSDSDQVLKIFTPGLVSDGVGRSHSLSPIKLFTNACYEAGANVSVMYENTNLSKRVVPWIVDRAVEQSRTYKKIKKSELIDSVYYRLFSIKP